MMDPGSIRERVERAEQRAGEGAWLVGYDVNGIQELVTASNRPIGMRGASQAIKDFDDECRRTASSSIFAGGGRGMELVPTKDAAEVRMKALVESFWSMTHGGVVAAAAVPYRRDAARASLMWLRRNLELAKDAANPPGGRLPPDKEAQCADCRALIADHSILVKDGERRVCARCYRLIKTARKDDEASQSLLEFASNGRIAVVSADGNNLGAFFSSLGSLLEVAAASEAIAEIFSGAHTEALGAIPKALSPVTGGDDIRLFLAPERVLTYVEALARGVERRAAAAGTMGGLLSPDRARALAQIGVGIGAVVAGDHYPASRLMELAQERERSAKEICGARSGASAGVRSAFDFDILTSGERASSGDSHAPLAMDERAWEPALRAARELRRVPTAQRAVLAERRRMDAEEFDNLFCYQVARSAKWHVWFDSCGVDWRDRAALRDHVRRVRTDLLELLPPRPGEETST